MADFAIISEETVKVFDRYVSKGAGKLTIGASFLAIMSFAVIALWDLGSKIWEAAKWVDSDKASKAVHAFAWGRAANTVMLLWIVIFLIVSGSYMAAYSLNALARVWRRPQLATDQIVLAWKETPPIKRIGFVALMVGAGAILLSLYVFMLLYTIRSFFSGY